MRLAILLLTFCGLGSADEMSLTTLRASAVARRDQPDVEPRGANEQLTVVKHQLRDWFESRLAGFGQHSDEGEFERTLNAELREAGLSCDDENANAQLPCPERNLSGYLGNLTVRRSDEFLILTTGVGIVCGYDHSAYIYKSVEDKWTRVWQNEQNTYTEKGYTPQNLYAVLISQNYSTKNYVVLTLGSYPWCSSNWQGVYYRLFPMGRDLEPAPLVNGDEYAYVGRHDPPIQGSATTDDLLVEFTVGSVDPSVHSREAIRHYKIEGGSARRTDPLALSPRDFVDEWLTTDWKESASWSESTYRGSMIAWRRRLKDARPEFMSPTMHCPRTPDLWQVALDSSGPQSTQPKPIYFLVRWRPPYQFRMVSVGDKGWPGCTKKDAAADQDRTLFPVQEWR